MLHEERRNLVYRPEVSLGADLCLTSPDDTGQWRTHVIMFEKVGIVVPLGDGRHPLRVARCLGKVGARLVLLSRDRNNVARMSTHCSGFLYSDPHSNAELLSQLLGMDACGSPEILLPVTTEGFLFAARSREALLTRFRVPPISTVDSLTIASDKWTLYEFALRNQIPVLRSTLLSEIQPSAVESGESPLVFPMLVKSRRKEGGDGARKVESAAELTALLKAPGGTEAEDYFVQRFVEGEDISLSTFCEHGEIRSYTLWKAVFYGKVPFRMPLCVMFGEHDRVLEIGTRLMKLLDWNGVCDIDFFVDRQSGEVLVLEINARFWGTVVGCASHGVNFPALMCERALVAGDTVWPTQTHGAYCHPKGLLTALRTSEIRGAILRHPLTVMGVVALVRDLGPEVYKVFVNVRRVVTDWVRRTRESIYGFG